MPALAIAEAAQPLVKGFGYNNLDHVRTVVHEGVNYGSQENPAYHWLLCSPSITEAAVQGMCQDAGFSRVETVQAERYAGRMTFHAYA